jgi:hypothetical protein
MSDANIFRLMNLLGPDYLTIDYVSAFEGQIVISLEEMRSKAGPKQRQIKALQGQMIEGEFYN